MSEETKNTNTWSLNNDNLWDSLTDYESDLTSNSINFNCSINKMYCSEMTSCEEAKYYLNICWILRLDQDSDWIPCESLCK